jgi:hypothetical protein
VVYQQKDQTVPEHSVEESARQLRLPEPLEAVLKDLSEQFGFGVGSLVAPVLTLAGAALGNSVVLETSIFPSAINACLDCAIVDETSDAEMLLQVLVQPLLEVQDRRIAARENLRAKEIRAKIRAIEEEKEEFFGRAFFRDPEAESGFDQRIQAYSELLHPLVLVANLAPGRLHEAVLRNGGTGLLDFVNGVGVRGRLKAHKKGRPDFEAITRAFHNQTREADLLDESKGPTMVRPAISSLVQCDQQTLACLLCARDSSVRQFADQLVICLLDTSGNSFGDCPAGVPDSWRALVSKLFGRRVTDKSSRLRLSSAAAELLVEYAQESRRPGDPHRLSKLAPVLAAKIALILELCAGESVGEISVDTMASAIELTRSSIVEANAAANRCVAADQSSGRAAKTARVLERIQAVSEISERELQRSANLRLAELRDITDEFVRLGQVRYLREGVLQALNKPT